MLRQQKKNSKRNRNLDGSFFSWPGWKGGLIDLGYSLRPSSDWISFLSAAQPTDQDGESVILLVVVVGDHFSFSHVQFFGGCEKEKKCLKRGVKKEKLCLKSKGCEKTKKLCVKRQKLCTSWRID